MELKSYEKPWLPAFKGIFLIIIGLISILQIIGSMRALSILFIILIGMISLLLISTGIIFKKSKFRKWSIVSGILNLTFAIILIIQLSSPRLEQISIILAWALFYALTEIIEAGLLIYLKNAFAALFLINALLTLLFSYFLYKVILNFNPQGVFYIGLIALVFGITNVLSSYMLSKFKES